MAKVGVNVSSDVPMVSLATGDIGGTAVAISLSNALPIQGVTGGSAIPSLLQNKQGFASGSKTYVAVGTGLTAYATPTDIFSIRNPAASGRIIQVRNMLLLTQATAAILEKFYWYKRGSLNTGGSPTIINAAQYDSADAPPVAVVQAYTVAPTIVDSAAVLFMYQQSSIGATTGAPTAINLGGLGGAPSSSSVDMAEPVTLRQGEELAINYNGIALPVGYTSVGYIQWTENSL